MKSLLILPVLLGVIVTTTAGVAWAGDEEYYNRGSGQETEVYDGNLVVRIDGSNFVEGDVIHANIYVEEIQPDFDTSITISILETGTKNIVETQTFVPDWKHDIETFYPDKIWKIGYAIDTGSSNFTPNVNYDLDISYEDKTKIVGMLSFVPTVVEQNIQAGELFAEGGTFKDTDKIQWINLNEELVLVYPTSIDRMFERGYLIDHELYRYQKDILNIRIFDPTFSTQPMTEAESKLLNIPFLK